MFDVVFKLFQAVPLALSITSFHKNKMISVNSYLFSNYFQHVTFGALAVSAKNTCNNCIFPFLFLFSYFFREGWGTYQLLSQQISWNSETLSRGQIAIKLRPVVKSATKIACSYCYNSECVQAKWQEHISRHFQCFLERWAEKANSYGEKYYNNYLHCDGIEIRNDFLHLFVNIYYMGNLACYLMIFL